MTLSEKIYESRKKAGLSQEALAERIGVSRQAVSKWETGEAVPEIGKLAALSKTLGVSADWLLSEEDEENTTTPPPQASKDYPDWLDRLPGFLLRMVRRFGWLVGVYVAVVGGLFSGMGFLGKFIVRSMFHSSLDSFTSIVGSAGFGDIYFSGFAQNNPVSILCSALIVFGLILVVAGVILAVVLKKYSK